MFNLNRKTANKAIYFLKLHRSKKVVSRISLMLCIFASALTAYIFMLPAITLEKNPLCGYEEHIHGEECFSSNSLGEIILICEKAEHIHCADCFIDDDISNELVADISDDDLDTSPAETNLEPSADTVNEPECSTDEINSSKSDSVTEIQSFEVSTSDTLSTEEIPEISCEIITDTVASPVISADESTASLDLLYASGENHVVSGRSFLSAAPLNKTAAASVRNMSWSETDPDGNGINLTKYASKNDDGTYTITLEQWTEGKVTEEKEIVPTDIILVLDQTSSLTAQTGGGWYRVYEPDPNIEDGRTQFLVYGYRSSSVNGGTFCNARYNHDSGSWEVNIPSDYVIDYSSSRYYLTYLPGGWTDVDAVLQNGYVPAYSYGYGYYGYSYYYDTVARGMWFRQYVDSHGVNNLDPLKRATREFICSVYDDAIKNDVDHRIAVIGFSSADATSYYTNGQYLSVSQNEDSLLSIADSLVVTGTETRTDLALSYADNILNTQDSSGRNRVVILFTDGGPTSSEIPIYDQTNESTMISSFDTFSNTVANAAIPYARSIKDKGVTIYTIGIFDGADGTPPADFSDPNAHWLKKIYLTDNILQYSYDNKFYKYNPVMPNRFLHLISSNYPEAQSMTSPGYFAASGNSYYLSAFSGEDIVTAFESIATLISAPEISLDGQTVVTDTVSQYFELKDAMGNVSTIHTYFSDYNGSSFSDRYEVNNLHTEIVGNKVSVSGYDYDSGYITDTPKPNTGDYGRKLIIEFIIRPLDDFLGGNAVPTNVSSETSISHPNHSEISDTYPEPQVNVPLSKLVAETKDKYVYLLGSLSESEIEDSCTLSYIGRWSNNSYPIDLDSEDLGYRDDYANLSVTLDKSSYNKLTSDTLYAFKAEISSKYVPALASSAPLFAPNRNPGDDAQMVSAESASNIYVFMPHLVFCDAIVNFGDERMQDDFYNVNDFINAKTTWHNDKLSSDDTAYTEFLPKKPEISIVYSSPDDAFLNGRVYTLEDIPISVSVLLDREDIGNYTIFSHLDCGVADAPVWENCTWENAHGDSPILSGKPAFLIHVKAEYELPQTGGAGLFVYYIVIISLSAAVIYAAIKIKNKTNK